MGTRSFLGRIIDRHLEPKVAKLTTQRDAAFDALIAAGKPITLTDKEYATFKAGADAASPEAKERFRMLARRAGREP